MDYIHHIWWAIIGNTFSYCPSRGLYLFSFVLDYVNGFSTSPLWFSLDASLRLAALSEPKRMAVNEVQSSWLSRVPSSSRRGFRPLVRTSSPAQRWAELVLQELYRGTRLLLTSHLARRRVQLHHECRKSSPSLRQHGQCCVSARHAQLQCLSGTYPPLTADLAEPEADMSAQPDLPGSASTVEQEDVHSLRSHGSSVSTTTDDQAALLRKDRTERAPQLKSAIEARRIKSATISSQRRKRTHPLGEQ